MIQRIQTLYLLLVVVCSVLLCCFAPVQFLTPISESVQQSYEIVFANVQNTTDATSVSNVMTIWALPILVIVIGLVALVTIFLFKNRLVQARLCIFNMVLMLGYYAVLAVYIFFACEQLHVDWFINVWSALPLVSIILTILAMRAIAKDEALVRAADRLR